MNNKLIIIYSVQNEIAHALCSMYWYRSDQYFITLGTVGLTLYRSQTFMAPSRETVLIHSTVRALRFSYEKG
jgi:hypothetical protein